MLFCNHITCEDTRTQLKGSGSGKQDMKTSPDTDKLHFVHNKIKQYQMIPAA